MPEVPKGHRYTVEPLRPRKRPEPGPFPMPEWGPSGRSLLVSAVWIVIVAVVLVSMMAGVPVDALLPSLVEWLSDRLH